jgi:hypothetical protein
MMKTGLPEILINIHRTTRCQMPEVRNFGVHSCENLKSHKILLSTRHHTFDTDRKNHNFVRI